MVTALNHAVADGRRAGGLNLSSSILTGRGEGEREAWKGALLPEATAFSGGGRCPSLKKINNVALTLLLQRTPGGKCTAACRGKAKVQSNFQTRSSADSREETPGPKPSEAPKTAFFPFYDTFATFTNKHRDLNCSIYTAIDDRSQPQTETTPSSPRLGAVASTESRDQTVVRAPH